MKKGFTEAQCNLLYQAEMWKEERVQVLKERAELLAENERLRKAKCLTWSFIRTLLEQGAAIRQDYDAGKFGESYEAYSARIDEAAREREDALTALEQKP
jgi:hypothetical protein